MSKHFLEFYFTYTIPISANFNCKFHRPLHFSPQLDSPFGETVFITEPTLLEFCTRM